MGELMNNLKELSELGLNINVDPELISNLFSKTTDEIDDSCEKMKNTLGRISKSKESSTPGSMSNLISLITQKIDADTK